MATNAVRARCERLVITTFDNSGPTIGTLEIADAFAPEISKLVTALAYAVNRNSWAFVSKADGRWQCRSCKLFCRTAEMETFQHEPKCQVAEARAVLKEWS